ncbi:MAG: dipeptide ABC transporter ATP-binding protein [Rhodospirillaceae bacterium]|nr:dipeptide ABC transporter ATP-binding protein [Rhodospirillaceae bacterium]
MSSSSEPVARLDRICLDYRHHDGWLRVLQEVSLDISPGEVIGLVGESGCGKSTLSALLLGYRHPSARVTNGRALFEGTDLLKLEREALDRIRGRRVALIPQNPTTSLNPSMRVGDQIAEVLRFHGVTPGAAATTRRVREVLESVSLPDPPRIARRYPHQLSGGQQQRVAIAMALACNPSLLILDEPTTGLDVTTQDQILRLLAKLRELHDMAMLYVTHDLGVVAQIADRVCVMYAGHVVETAHKAVVFDGPRHPYTQGLIASIPRIADGEARTGHPLKGLLRRSELPRGCPFFPRCDFSRPSCGDSPQRLETIGNGHQVACQRWRDIKPDVDAARAAPTVRRASGTNETLLSLEHVSLRYGRRGFLDRLLGLAAPTVVHDVSLTIERGEVFALVGESGSGKSTVAKAISGLLAPFTGELRFGDNVLPGSVEERPANLKRRIQYIFQNPDASLNPRARVRTSLARPIVKFLSVSRLDVGARIATALGEVRLPESYAIHYPDQLSGGERQRVALARALVAQPDLLLCDEVLSSLDVSVQASILGLLEALKRDTAVTMLFISHDLAVVRSLADRVAVLFQGHLCEVGDKDLVFAPPFHPYTHSLLQAVPDVGKRARSIDSPDIGASTQAGAACAFVGRCPWQLGNRCVEESPPWRTFRAGLRIRCHHETIDLERLARGESFDRTRAASPQRQPGNGD